jgi:hypothetical protein
MTEPRALAATRQDMLQDMLQAVPGDDGRRIRPSSPPVPPHSSTASAARCHDEKKDGRDRRAERPFRLDTTGPL